MHNGLSLRSSALLLFAASILTGCQRPLPEEGNWTGALHMHAGRSLSVRLHLDLRAQPARAWFLVGDEVTMIPEVTVRSDSVILEFAEYSAAIRATWDGERLNGFYERYRKDTVRIPWTALPEAASEKPPAATPPAVVLAGAYRVFFQRAGGIDTLTSAAFWTRGDSVFGSFIASDGDYGLLAGVQRGDTAVLDRFNGWQALKLELWNSGPSWTGNLYSRDLPPTAFRLEPRPTADPVLPPDKVTTARDTRAPFRFSGVTPEGEILTESSPRFKGKPLIVDIMGTWCHNCMDAAPVLQRISKEYAARGLEVVALSFELGDDTTAGRKNLALFRKRYGIGYTLLFCGSTDGRYTQPALHDQLKNFYAYPTTLFLDRRGRIGEVHSGFRGPGSGQGYQNEVSLLYRKAEELTRP